MGNHRLYDEGGRLTSRGYSLEEIMRLAAVNGLEIVEEPVDSYKDDEDGNIIKEGQWNVVMRKKINSIPTKRRGETPKIS